MEFSIRNGNCTINCQFVFIYHKGQRQYDIRSFQGLTNKENNFKTDEKSWDPELIRMLKDIPEVIFQRFKTDKPITDFTGSKMENFSDVLDVRIGKYKGLLSRSW